MQLAFMTILLVSIITFKGVWVLGNLYKHALIVFVSPSPAHIVSLIVSVATSICLLIAVCSTLLVVVCICNKRKMKK